MQNKQRQRGSKYSGVKPKPPFILSRPLVQIKFFNAILQRRVYVNRYLSRLFNFNNERLLRLRVALMRHGRSSFSHRILFRLLILIKERLLRVVSSATTLELVLSLLEPNFYLKRRVVSGRPYLFPMVCSEKKKENAWYKIFFGRGGWTAEISRLFY